MKNDLRNTGWAVLAGMLLVLQTAWAAMPPDDLLQRLKSQLRARRTNCPESLWYVHLDKPYYTSGEKVYFKIYQQQEINTASKEETRPVYLQFINDQNKVISQQVFPAVQGQASGAVLLPATLASGIYRLQVLLAQIETKALQPVYTAAIPVENPDNALSAGSKTGAGNVISAITGNFYPEGGPLVNNLASTVGFFLSVNVLTKNQVYPVKIVDQEGTEAASFAATAGNMHTFTFTPQAGKHYQSYLLVNGKRYQLPWPETLLQGVVLAGELTADQIIITLQKAGGAAGKQPEYLVIAQAADSIYVAEKVSLTTAKQQLAISKKTMPAGLIAIQVWDPAGTLVNERFLYISPEAPGTAKVTTDQLRYGPRKKVTLTLSVQDAAGRPAQANLSLAVRESGQYGGAAPAGQTLTSAWRVPGAGNYLGSGTTLAEGDINQALLAYRNQKTNISDLADSLACPEPLTGFPVSGKLVNALTGKPLVQHMLMLSALDPQRTFRRTITDQRGYFRFDELDFYGPTELLFQTLKIPGEQVRPTIVLDTILPVKERNQHQEVWPETDSEAFRNFQQKARLKAQLLKSFTTAPSDTILAVTATSNPIAKNTYLATFQDMRADERIALEEFISFPTVADLFKELVPGVKLGRRKGNYRIQVLNRRSKLYFKGNPLVVIDGIPVFDHSLLFNLDPGTLKTIEAIGDPGKLAIFGQMAFNGLIAVRTVEQDFYPPELPDVYRTAVQGYEAPARFPEITYPSEAATKGRRPDLRSRLYWNPVVETDASGQTRITFYTSDEVGTFWVQVEGITSTQQPVSGQVSFEVQPVK